MIVSSSDDSTVERGVFGPIGASLTKARLRHLATVLWFSPYRAAEPPGACSGRLRTASKLGKIRGPQMGRIQRSLTAGLGGDLLACPALAAQPFNLQDYRLERRTVQPMGPG